MNMDITTIPIIATMSRGVEREVNFKGRGSTWQGAGLALEKTQPKARRHR